MTQPAQDDRFSALGQLVERAAVMEIALRMTFCALVGGRYAAVVAAGQETHWLIESCDALARQRHDILPDRRDAIRAALQSCRDANRNRNRLVHDAWGTGPDGTPAVMQSVRHSYLVSGRQWDAGQILATAAGVAEAQHQLLTSVEEALGYGSLETAGQVLSAQTRRGTDSPK
jgi:hypothetical protein